MPTDTYQPYVDSVIAPAQTCFTINPNDTADLPVITKSLYIGRSGDIMLVAASSETPVLFRNVVAGTTLDVRVRAVRQTGTSALDLVGLA